MAVDAPRRYTTRLDKQITHIEDTDAWKRAHRLASIARFGVTYDRPEWAEEATAELLDIVERRLRQLGVTA